MRVESVKLRWIEMPLLEAQRTSYGLLRTKDALLVELEVDGGVRGIAECVAMREPTYTEETVQTARHVLKEFLIPLLKDVEFCGVEDLKRIPALFGRIRGNAMAKAGLEMALWDAFSANSQIPLVELLGGTQSEVAVGISIGMAVDEGLLRDRVVRARDDGYQRVKLKISPGRDFAPLAAVRKAVPELPLMADANSSYRLEDVEQLRRLDELSLMMIEQPLQFDDLFDHAALQRDIQTPVCLDESIRSVDNVRVAREMGACRVINLKAGRVGGFASSLDIHDFAREAGIDLWCGGMYETGIGRLHNIALCSLPGFTLPTDTGPSDRYFARDIIEPPVRFVRPGYLEVERFCGVGDRVDWKLVDTVTIASETVEIGY